MAKIYIASAEVVTGSGPIPGEHSYWVLDLDGDPYSGDERIIRGGPTNVPGDERYIIEVDRPIAESRDALDGDDPYEDRNYTTVEEGDTAEIQAKWDTMAEAAKSVGQEVDEPWPGHAGSPVSSGTKAWQPPVDDYDFKDTNCNMLSNNVGSSIGRPLMENRPKVGGDTGSGERFGEWQYIGGDEKFQSPDDEVIVVTDSNRPGYDQGGADDYIVDMAVPPTSSNPIVIHEDNDAGTTDRVILQNVEPEDLRFVRDRSTGDLKVYEAGKNQPFLVIKNQFDDGGAKINTLWVYPPNGGDPVALPLNNPANFPPGTVLPAPGWVEGALPPWSIAPTTGSPLTIDLDADGVELTTFNAETTTTFFDIDGDGFAEQTAWVGADDGLLVRDLDQSGTIDSVDELFGSPTIDGFALLATLDDNEDHVINQYDDVWTDLAVWQDANGDATTQDGELHSLASLGIVSVDLAGVTSSTSTINGNPISHTSTYRLDDGSTRSIVDAWFVHDDLLTAYASDYTQDVRTLFLPTLRGFGELANLHIAMSQNDDLLNLVHQFAIDWDSSRFADGASLDADIAEILWAWAGVDDVNPSSRGAYIDARNLEFLEEFFGEEYIQNQAWADPFENASVTLNEVWERLFYAMKAQLLAQVGADSLFGDTVFYNVFSGELEGDMDLSSAAVDALEAAAPAPGSALQAYWEQVAQFIAFSKGFDQLDTVDVTLLDDAIYATDSSMSWEDIVPTSVPAWLGYALSGTPDDDTLNGGAGTDILDGGAGNDTVSGGAGNDTLSGGVGNDVLRGEADNDTLYGDDGDDTLYGGIENDILSGGDGSDTLYGDDGDDTLSGGAGGDNLHGWNGNDIYEYTSGDDYYFDHSGTDTIKLPSGITANDLSFAVVSDGMVGNLIISVGSLGTIESARFLFYTGTLYTDRIETLVFADTSTFNFESLTELTTYGGAGNDGLYGVNLGAGHLNDTLYGLDGDDQLTGNDGNDTLDGGNGNDRLFGGNGNDTYIASPGFDKIEWDSGGSDTIYIPDGFDVGDLTIIRPIDSNDGIVLNIDGLGQIYLMGQLYYSGSYAVETISFNGASTLDLMTAQIESIGTSGSDNLSGITAGASINDIMDGREGNDYLSGNLGDDVYYLSAGNDIINEQGGSDTIKFREGVTAGNVVVFREANGSSSTALVIQDQYGNRITAGQHFTVEGGGDNSAYRIEQIVFHDTTTWTLSSMEIETRGSASGDYIDGTTAGDASSVDTIYGLGGGDSIYAASGNDWADGGDGNDTVSGGAGNDQLYGGAGDDYIKGDGDDDIIFAGVGLDLAEDDGGADILHVVGDVTINDITLSTYSLYHTNIVINSGVDEIQVRYQESSPANYAIESIRFDDGFETNLTTYNSWLNGTSGNDMVAGNANDNTLIGFAGNDTITGGDGADDAHGGAGNDSLEGENGDDLLYGGDGDDTLYGGVGLDTMHGGDGADTFLFETASAFSDIDVIRDFSVSDDDVLDLTDILDVAYDPLTDAISDFIQFTESSGSTFVEVDRDGTGATYSFAQIVKLENVTGLSSPELLETNGNLLAA